ncbi:MAG: phosphoglycerate dehydrogenase [Candidatus Omnitrophica bacterium]|nr:phosphoglycerate dehydrogenase [Candidatus Omnitrophota bacterium]
MKNKKDYKMMDKKIKILITDSFEKEGIDILKNAGFEVKETGKLSPEELCEIIGEYDAVIVRSATKITREVIQKGKNLKIIGRAGVGLDNIDIEASTHAGIIVMNAPEGNTLSVAEHTIGMLLALVRNIPAANHSLKNGQWEKKKFMGSEVYNKTLGIIGLGRIGRCVAKIARSFGMKILGYDPYIDKDAIEESGITIVNFPGLLKQSDFITLHIPLNDSTYHLIGEKEFELMKEGVYVINCSRGGIIDEEALAKYIQKGKVKGAAIDVFEKEPPDPDNPLLKLEQVIVTPHLGASTKEAQINVAQQLASQIVQAFTTQEVHNAVNLPSLDKTSMDKIRGYLSLGQKLGMFLKQLSGGNLKQVCITYSGEITNYDLSLLRANIIIGLLKDEFDRINLVNAGLILKERGITLSEEREESGGEFTNLITVSVKNTNKVSASGTIIKKGEERIVKIDDFSVDASPEGYLLICYNEDKPGIMGHIGTILGKKGVNIASMTLGRDRKGGKAITVLNLDQGIDKEVLKKIEEFPAIHSVRLVRI